MKTNIYTVIFLFLSLIASVHANQPSSLQKGNDVHIAIIDTGIDPDLTIFKNKLWVGKKKVTNVGAYGLDFSKNAENYHFPFDEHGHGTHIAGIIASLVPNAKLHILKYYNPRASGEENLHSTIKALEYAVDLGVDIINYSSGGPEQSIVEKRILQKAERKGILIISAAGNERRNIDVDGQEFFPASYGFKNIITVGAHDDANNPIPSSNWGKNSVDLFAPGKDIKSTLPNGRIGKLTGTSQSTAFVSAATAKILFKSPGLSYLQIKRLLTKGASKISMLKDRCLSGGLLNIKKTLSLLKSNKKKSSGDIIYRVSKR